MMKNQDNHQPAASVTEKVFEKTLNVFMNALDQYSQYDFRKKANPGEWSLGQLYAHIITDTNWYFDQLENCFGNNRNLKHQMSGHAQNMYLLNQYPDIKIKGHSAVPGNDSIFIDSTKEALQLLLKRSQWVWNRIQNEHFYGKTEHPGFKYLFPLEWYQFAEMHLRHHLKQKQRLDIQNGY